MTSNTKNKGFTIVEMVISLFILAFAVVGIYSAFSTVVVSTSGASNRFTAAYLSQEGLEIIRNIRDNNWLQGNNWNNGFSECTQGCEWEADYKTGTAFQVTPLRPWTSDGNPLKIDSNGFYSYDQTTGSIETKFRRKITVIQAEENVLKVSSQIFWEEKGQEFTFEAEEYLYNWY